MPYQHILVDDPKAAGAAHHAEPPREAQCAEQPVARRDFRGAGGGRPRCGNINHNPSWRRVVLFGWLRSVLEQFRRPALSHRRRTRPMVAPRRRGLVLDLGSRKTRDRPGARLLPRRRHRARHRLRRRLCRRRCRDRLSAGAADEPARHAISSVAGRHAPRHGIDADGRRHVRAARRRNGVLRRARFRIPSSSNARSISPNARPRCRSSCSSSTSARCIGRWRSWAPAPRCAPAPKSRRSPSPPKPAATTCRRSGATAEASRRSSTSATRRSGIIGRGRSELQQRR